MKKDINETDSFSTRYKKNKSRFLGWMITWVATMILADKAELYGWYASGLISMLAIVINAGLGIGMTVMFIRFLNHLDELQRKIQMDSLAISVGFGIVGGATLSLLATANFIPQAEASYVMFLMMGSYVVGVIVGEVRYK